MKIPLILVSGLLSNECVWSHQIKNLDDLAIVKVVSPTQDTPQKMVEEILKQAPDQFALAGHSMGGWLCLEVMRRAKKRVSKLCLLNTTAKSDSPTKKAAREAMIQRVENGQFPEIVKELVDHFVFNTNVKIEVEKMLLKVGAETFIQQEKSMLMREECESLLPLIHCPTDVIHAAKDNVFTLEDHQLLAKNIANAKLSIVEGCGHMSPMEKPEAITSLLRAWIKEE